MKHVNDAEVTKVAVKRPKATVDDKKNATIKLLINFFIIRLKNKPFNRKIFLETMIINLKFTRMTAFHRHCCLHRCCNRRYSYGVCC